MRSFDIFGYLVGREASIRAVATERAALATGAALVLLAGVAREYDDTDLLRAPWVLTEGLVLSTIVAAFLWLLLRPVVRLRFLSLLAAIWMTAPLAWIYALPVERFCDPYTAEWMNLGLLALVACWRVALLARVLAVLRGRCYPFWLGAVLAPAAGMAAAAGLLVGFDEGIRHIGGMIGYRSPEDVVTHWVGQNVPAGCGVVLVAGAVMMFVFRQRGAPSSDEPPVEAGRAPWPALLACAAAFALLLPEPQREVRNSESLEQLFAHGAVDSAVARVAGLRPSDLSPRHAIPPDPYGGRVVGEVAATLASAAYQQLPRDHWYRAVPLDALTRENFMFTHPTDASALVAVLRSRPELKAWGHDHPGVIGLLAGYLNPDKRSEPAADFGLTPEDLRPTRR